eukprot:3779568-Lingulodinium_polyedra.AAC.1
MPTWATHGGRRRPSWRGQSSSGWTDSVCARCPCRAARIEARTAKGVWIFLLFHRQRPLSGTSGV